MADLTVLHNGALLLEQPDERGVGILDVLAGNIRHSFGKTGLEVDGVDEQFDVWVLAMFMAMYLIGIWCLLRF